MMGRLAPDRIMAPLLVASARKVAVVSCFSPAASPTEANRKKQCVIISLTFPHSIPDARTQHLVVISGFLRSKIMSHKREASLRSWPPYHYRIKVQV
jgi:hypothetical protein